MPRAAQLNLTAQSYMKQRKFSREGSEAQYGPRTVGEILHDFFENSNEPLAVAYREHMAKAEAEDEPDRLFRDIFPDTFLDVDLKMFRRERGRVPVGAHLNGVLTHDGEDHFSFIENASEKKMPTTRNPRLYKGSCVNVILSNDGSPRPTFNRPRYTKQFTFQDFCREAARELLVVSDLVQE